MKRSDDLSGPKRLKTTGQPTQPTLHEAGRRETIRAQVDATATLQEAMAATSTIYS
ncbi:hypothetical protein E4U45_000820, partial [Claviceps purpurea]